MKTAHTAVTIAPTEDVTAMNRGVTAMLGITESHVVMNALRVVTEKIAAKNANAKMKENVIQLLALARVLQMLQENSVKMDVRKGYSAYNAKEDVIAIVQDAED